MRNPSRFLENIKNLYYDEKRSVADISQILHISQDSVYYAMRKNNMPRRTFSEANSASFSRRPLSFVIRRNLSKSDTELKTVGVALY